MTVAAYKVNTRYRYKMALVRGLHYMTTEMILTTCNVSEVFAEVRLRFPGYCLADCMEVPIEEFDAEQAVIAPRPKSLKVSGVSIE